MILQRNSGGVTHSLLRYGGPPKGGPTEQTGKGKVRRPTLYAYPRAQPSRDSLSRDGTARTSLANTARGAPSGSPCRHGGKQIQARARHSTSIAVAFATGIEGKPAGLRNRWAARNPRPYWVLIGLATARATELGQL